MNTDKFKVSTFCSGIGSPEQALSDLGVEYESVFAAEIDKYARQTYLANHKTNMMLEDMTKCEYVGDEYYADLNISGLPCQAFSLAGKRLGELDKRGLLFYDFYRYVKNQQPKVFIIENVKGLLSDAGGKTFQNWIQLLGRSLNTHVNMFNHEDSLLYNLHFKVLNSKDFGVPQNRERVFIVGIRNDLPNEFRFPVGERLTVRLKDVLEESVDEKYYLSDKMIAGLLQHQENSIEKGRGFKFEPLNPEMAQNAKCLRANSFKMGPDDNYIDEINNKDGLTQYGTGQDTKLSPLNGLSQSLGSGHFNQTKVLVSNEPFCVAMRGRNPENSSDITAGAPMEQRLEPNTQGTTNTITSVQKDNLIVEPELRQVAQLDGFESEGRIYDSAGLARTIKDGGGGGDKTGWYSVDEVVQLNPSKESGGVQPYQQNRVYSDYGIMTTLDTECNRKSVLTSQRIRRLTPLECFRLQGYPDTFNKPVSDTQLYKQAGNSITVNVMKAILQNIVPIIRKSYNHDLSN